MANGMKPFRTSRLALLLLASTLSLPACGTASDGSTFGSGPVVDNGFESDNPTGVPGTGQTEFDSDNPAGDDELAGTGGRANTDSGAPSNAGSASSAPNGNGGSADAARAVEEADILKVEGNLLYAISRYGGLAVVDISQPDKLKLLGRKRTEGMPFEMYVRHGRAYVLMNEFGRWVRSSNSPYGSWVQTSEILAFDVSNPAQITEAAHFDVPGAISDSRLVGDALYLVTNENGYCWSCASSPGTVVTSFNVAGGAIAKVDQLAYRAPTNTYTAWKRSVSATNQRMYIAGPEWNWQSGQANSIIQVVDITDPSGKLVKGADVPVAGQINSRWQMDEEGGVLRVVSQFQGNWNGSANPRVQTFTVQSAQSIKPLGQTELRLPKPETLRSVRFDGTRGYAITAERKDPLFTIDLSDPAKPRQAGELHMPGWVFHMEPRGNRLIGFGFDDTVASNAKVAVSLFDVSDLAKPTMMKRVTFGEGWSQFAEDQDRIHKSVRVLDDAGLIAVPFASYGRWSGTQCSTPPSGIQLIDYAQDNLTLRGLVPQHGMPRRAFLANGRLLAISDRNVTSFDIGSRDKPVKTAELDLSNPAYRMAELPNHVASITSDWWTGEVLLSVTPKQNADDAEVSGKLSLASLAAVNAAFCSAGRNAWASWYAARLFTQGNLVYVTVPVYTYEGNARGGKLVVGAVDASNPAAPVLVGKTEVKFTDRSNSGYYGYGFYGDGFWDGWSYSNYLGGMNNSLVASGQGIVQVGSKLAYLELDQEWIPNTTAKPYTTWSSKLHRKLHVVDMTNPSNPVAAAPISLADSLGSSPLHVYEGKVLTSRWVKTGQTKGKVRFYMDQVDLKGPTPGILPSINIPGSLLLADEASHRIVTADYSVKRTSASTWSDCQAKLGYRGRFFDAFKECLAVDRQFKLADVTGTKVTLRQTMVPPSQNFAGIQIADDRIYVTRYRRYESNAVGVSYPGGPSSNGQPKIAEDGGLWAIGGIRSGQMGIVSEFVGDAEWPLAASGTRVALYTQGGVAFYDTATAKPTLLKEVNLRGAGYTSHVLMGRDRAICSLGDWGMQSVRY